MFKIGCLTNDFKHILCKAVMLVLTSENNKLGWNGLALLLMWGEPGENHVSCLSVWQ